MSRAELVIIGAGGFGREAAQAALAGGFDGRLLGFLDDSAGPEVAGQPVLGPIALAKGLDSARFVITIGRPDRYTSRHAIVRQLALPPDRYTTVIHPGAHLAVDTQVGPGTVVLAGTVATAGVVIGSHVAVMPATVLTHECRVEDFATLAAGVQVAGGVRIGRGAYVGAGTKVREGAAIGPWAMTGMGSLVLNHVAERRLAYGAPAVDRGPSPAAEYDDAWDVS